MRRHLTTTTNNNNNYNMTDNEAGNNKHITSVHATHINNVNNSSSHGSHGINTNISNSNSKYIDPYTGESDPEAEFLASLSR